MYVYEGFLPTDCPQCNALWKQNRELWNRTRWLQDDRERLGVKVRSMEKTTEEATRRAT